VVVDPDHAGLQPLGDALALGASELFARPIASSSDATVTIGTTGPKISSFMIRMSWVTPVRTAGA
jgi:hypothetical protein